MSDDINISPAEKADSAEVDLREQLVNDGLIGPIEEVSLPEATITRVRGLMFDIDPGLFRDDIAPPEIRQDPARFYETVLAKMLDSHDVLRRAEVRRSGTGLHVLLQLCPFVELHNEIQRAEWACRIEIVQAALPIDPHQPGITALTRPIGSVNSKCGRKVASLRSGQAISPAEVIKFADEIYAAPVSVIGSILFGGDRIAPCPLCGKASLSFKATPPRCYGCGAPDLETIYAAFLSSTLPSDGSSKKEVPNA